MKRETCFEHAPLVLSLDLLGSMILVLYFNYNHILPLQHEMWSFFTLLVYVAQSLDRYSFMIHEESKFSKLAFFCIDVHSTQDLKRSIMVEKDSSKSNWMFWDNNSTGVLQSEKSHSFVIPTKAWA